MKLLKRVMAAAVSAAMLCTSIAVTGTSAQTAKTTDAYTWDTMEISGGGFVSGIVTGQEVMYCRTDVGGAYKYNFETQKWEQLLSFLNEEDRGLLSVDAMCIDPTDDNTVYMLCGCAYFSGARTVIFKTTDGGQTFTRTDVTDLIQVHGNGDGRHFGEAIAVDPDNPDILYCGGDVTAGDSALIWSQDGGATWEPVQGYDDLGFYTNSINWPTWTDHMARGLTDGAYNTQNGVSSICIADGKVYVATSNAAEGNVAVADVGSDTFEVLSADLPTSVYPSRINQDCDGNLLITYVAGVCFGNGSGGIYRYNIADGSVDNISPVNNSFGACQSAPDDPDTLIATTCAVWSSQSWDKEKTCWGEWLYRSTDGGATWESIYPGKMSGIWEWNEEAGEMQQSQLYDYLQDGGCSWIYGKAIHWSGALVVNPQDPTEILVTSGNGVFKWENIWTDDPQAIFHARGIEEVVALDMVSVPGGNSYSAIGDYDGFIHTSYDEAGVQYQPNMGSTSAIAYCPANPDVLARVAQNDGTGYYSLDGGATWTEMKFPNGGGKISVTQLEDGTYRILYSSSDNAQIQYTDDFGGSWSSSSGLTGTKTVYTLVEAADPSIVYGYGIQYNSYWFYDTSKSEPTFDDAHYIFFISKDYGATFTATDLCFYDQCDHVGRIAYLGEDNLIVGAGWYGMYSITDGGKTVTKKDVFYCKSVGYGAPEQKGDVNTLYMYGKPAEDDIEGIYRSQDGGDTWVLINSDHLYGGTGNGNFLVGDMTTYGTIYMSTVGCGIVCGYIGEGGTDPGICYGDADLNGEVDILDVIALSQALMGAGTLSEEAARNADCDCSGNVSSTDTLIIMKYLVKLITELPV